MRTLVSEKLRAALYYEYDGKCAICGTTDPNTGKGAAFHVDHDHRCCPGRTSCGKCVRGILCQLCNRIIGMLHDNPEEVEAVLAYLRRYSASPV